MTTPSEAEFWVVEVRDARDPELGLPGYVQRYRVVTAEEAWGIYAEAVRHGFEASADQVKQTKVVV